MDCKRRRAHGYDCLFIGLIFLLQLINVLGQSSTVAPATTTATPWYDLEYPKAVVTIAVIAAALIIGVIIAKLADKCYERLSLRDDASDMSEGTKALLRQQLAMMSFRKNFIIKKPKTAKEIREQEDMRGRVAFTKWRANVIARREIREAEAQAGSPVKKTDVIPLELSKSAMNFNETKNQWDNVDGVVIAGATTSDTKTDSSPSKSKQPVKGAPTPVPKESPKKENKKVEQSDEFQFIDETIAALDSTKKDDKKTGNSPSGAKTVPVVAAVAVQKPNTDNKVPYSRHINKREDSFVSRPPTAAGNKNTPGGGANRPTTAANRPTTAAGATAVGKGGRPTTAARPTTANRKVAPMGVVSKK